MANKKIVCLGGGSLYFPGALADLVCQEPLTGSEIVLYDLDAAKVKLMAGLARRLAREAGYQFKIRGTVNLVDAVDGADFAISSIGGSGAEITPNVYGSRFHDADMRIPAKYGVHQVIGDTGGPAGMMMALRSIPVYLNICRAMEKRCPGVVLLNHSNPMAALMRAMHKYTSIQAVGICHGVQIGARWLAELLNCPLAELDYTWIGTNHYYWFTRVRREGRDVYPQLKRALATTTPPAGRAMCFELSRIYEHAIVYASDDHVVEFYPFLAQVPGGQKDLPYGLAKSAMDHSFDESRPPSVKGVSPRDRAAFFRRYRDILDKTHVPPQARRVRGAASGGEEIGAIIAAIAEGKRKVCIVNVANRGAIPNLPLTAEVEVEAVTDRSGVRPVYMGDCPLTLKGILEKRFVWHELVADAAVTGDRRLALQALLTDEMATWPAQAQAMLEELLQASHELVPQFFSKKTHKPSA